jgi:hypothetical protein
MATSDANKRSAEVTTKQSTRLGGWSTRQTEEKDSGATEGSQKEWRLGWPNQKERQSNAGSCANHTPEQTGSLVTVH